VKRWACLLGQPLGFSLSPRLHNAAFEAAGLDAEYELRDTAPADLARAIDALRAEDCLGANVTAPHKQTVMSLLDEVSDSARAVGAVNTVVKARGRLLGDNTDARGLACWLHQAGIDVHGKRVLVLGAGGAARASVWAAAQHGAAEIRVLNRTLARAEDLVRALRPAARGARLTCGPLEEAAERADRAWDVVVNATSMGHHNAAPVVHPNCYSPQAVAIELVYNPPVTGFLRAAASAGARTENGLGMLVYQAALAFECWTGRPAPIDVYEKAATS
jgi:shikimate dehydrogenase